MPKGHGMLPCSYTQSPVGQSQVYALQIVISRIATETDSSILATAIRTSDYDYGPGGVIIFKEIRELLSLHFTHESIIHVPRSCNCYAHKFAHSGLERDPDQPIIWFDPLPSFVCTLLNPDLVALVSRE